MNTQSQHSKKSLFWIFRMILKDKLTDLWEWWQDVHLLGKILLFVFVFMPSTFITLAIIFDEKTNIIIEYIHMFAGLSVVVWSIAGLFWVGYMFETPERRRKFYLILMFGLWVAAIYGYFFVEDPDVQYALMVMAVVGGVWLIIPLFLSMFRSVVYYRDDD